MCGIVGWIGKNVCRDTLLRMNDLAAHRGPNDSGSYLSPDGRVGLAMRRLSILDLAGGHQPMCNEDGQVWIVFNGEIYNAPELRPELEAKGHHFRTHNSDTEVLIHLYEEYGTGMLDRLNGMFAFAIHDRRRDILFAARDRLGIKPFYYTEQHGSLAFASEMKSLLLLPGFVPEVDRESLFHYLTLLYVPGPASILKGISRLPAGCFLEKTISGGSAEITRYWRPRFRPDPGPTVEEWSRRIRTSLRDAVRRWTLSDVPIGCSLSGGLDSSSIVGLMREAGINRIKTYSLGFSGKEEAGWDELPLARQVAARWGTEHKEFLLSDQEILQDLPTMVRHLDEPYGGGLPSWYIYRLMAPDVRVALTGTGGDEIFGNYGKFRRYEESRRLLALCHLGARGRGCRATGAALLRAVARLGPGGFASRLEFAAATLEFPFGRHYHAQFNYFSDETKRKEILGFNSASYSTARYMEELADDCDSPDIRDRVAYADLLTQLPEEFLLMTDRFSMAHHVEARVPMLDHLFVEEMLRIPAALRTRPDDLKYLLKKAVGDLLPPALLQTRKRGFDLPVALWLRGGLRAMAEELLSPSRLRAQGLIRPEFHARYVAPHMAGNADHAWRIWPLFMFQLWHRTFVEEHLWTR